MGVRVTRGGSTDEVRVLAIACLIVGLVLAVTVGIPYSPTAPRGLGAVLTAVALCLAGALHVFRDHVRRAHLHGVLVLAIVLIGVCVASATTPDGLVLTAMSFIWPALYSAVFHERRALLRHLVATATSLGLALAAAGASSAPQTWFFIMATTAGIGLVLNSRMLSLRVEAMIDPLTGALSRRAFDLAAQMEMARAVRSGHPLTLVMLDLDRFKDINDQYGHAAGDTVLAGLARSWRASMRPDDVLGRFGGDEFVIVMPRTDRGEAEVVLARLRRDLCDWSAGVATWQGETYEEWFAAADSRLYTAKARH
ncbi:GGDEF domain-containing protein [Cellulomonas bogoriensis]|uniref:Diguanylate cyclase n=1 Tax=Cellulomonas bogoriensis 69B4 = DSM 16987 TaxID=1386082 RepID=A0A0A0C1P3_9CELL|nr:GGDEF domain-containing protein [Cellulomonas bogoriensis]KGM13274.1 diguanylate cyclase [Cellulomonas bogoriensis 69B4 = DSM 16987]